MNEAREYAKAVWVSDDLWWITGGFDNAEGNSLSSTELYDASARHFVPYVDLPTPMHSHNMVNINATHTVAVDEDIYIVDRWIAT